MYLNLQFEVSARGLEHEPRCVCGERGDLQALRAGHSPPYPQSQTPVWGWFFGFFLPRSILEGCLGAKLAAFPAACGQPGLCSPLLFPPLSGAAGPWSQLSPEMLPAAGACRMGCDLGCHTSFFIFLFKLENNNSSAAKLLPSSHLSLSVMKARCL